MIPRLLIALFASALIVAVVSESPAQQATQTTADPARSTDAASTAKTAEPEKPATTKAQAKIEKATFASGCFWCGEAVFERIKGVKSVVSGYAGGTVPNPTYEMVSTGETGHAEAFQVEYDSSVVSYETLLKYFWASHDPTTPNQQGPDYGTQYRSVIFYHNDAQKAAAQKSFQELAKSAKTENDKAALLGTIVTQLVPMGPFYPAEAYHQDYYRKHRNSNPYCPTYITPKLKKLHLIK
jgi:peptide-methionine (S)-S-oxide reductase